jgi:hypothetical protein
MNFFVAVMLLIGQIADIGGGVGKGKPSRQIISGTASGYMVCSCYPQCELCESFDGDGNLIGTISICPPDPECR